MRRQTYYTLLSLAAMSFLTTAADGADPNERIKKIGRPITRLTFDPSAPRVELFEGMEDGRLESRVIANGPGGGRVLITNNTDESLTVELPQSFVTVNVLKQFGAGGGLGGGGLGGGGLGGGGGGLGGGGAGQNQGGGFGGGGLGGGGGGLGGGGLGGGGLGGGGQGFFSVPPEKTVAVPYVSVCLNHGKDDPTPRHTYKLVKVDEYTEDPVLKELISMVGTGRLAPKAAQAAVWNRTDNMSWQQLAAKGHQDLFGRNHSYFTGQDLMTAQLIQKTAVARIVERGESVEVPATEPRLR